MSVVYLFFFFTMIDCAIYEKCISKSALIPIDCYYLHKDGTQNVVKIVIFLW